MSRARDTARMAARHSRALLVQTRRTLPLLLACSSAAAAPVYDVRAVRAHSSEFSDLSLFSVRASPIQGRGLFIRRALKAGERAGLHWFESAGRRKGVHFYPAECNFPMSLRAAMPSSELLACFARATNHACDANFEIDFELLQTGYVPAGFGSRAAAIRNTTRLVAFYFKARRDLPAGSEVSFNYLTTPEYISKPRDAVGSCKPDPSLMTWRRAYDRAVGPALAAPRVGGGGAGPARRRRRRRG